jgi:hypothetical protein
MRLLLNPGMKRIPKVAINQQGNVVQKSQTCKTLGATACQAINSIISLYIKMEGKQKCDPYLTHYQKKKVLFESVI